MECKIRKGQIKYIYKIEEEQKHKSVQLIW